MRKIPNFVPASRLGGFRPAPEKIVSRKTAKKALYMDGGFWLLVDGCRPALRNATQAREAELTVARSS